jgi:thiosulfate/3-mercaptopyruvate sulfurtransferase
VISHTLVSTDTLASHLDGSWVIVDCRFDLQNGAWGREQYLAGHIPGAVYASLDDDLAGARTGRNGRHPLPPVEALATTFGRLGIARGTPVIVYDLETGMFASRLWWLLRYLGHDEVAQLDGGWAKWVREGRPVARGEEIPTPVVFEPAPRPQMRAALGDVLARLGDPDTLLIDARAPERYEGQVEPIDRVAGHIPGAVNHYYRWNLADDGTMLAPEELRARFARLLGDRPPQQAIVYCGSGVSACNTLLAMEHAGLSGAQLYPGSWSEWSADPTRPVETGPARR